MRTTKLCSLLVAGTLALFSISCREGNRNDNDNHYGDVQTIGDDTLGDGKIGDDRLGDGRIGNDKLGDGKIGDADDHVVIYTSAEITSRRAMITGENGNRAWKVREDLNSKGRDEVFERDGQFHFYPGGSFSLTADDKSSRTGTWSYDGTKMGLKYSGQGTTYYYTVSELTNNKMKLVASDGSELVLVDRDFR